MTKTVKNFHRDELKNIAGQPRAVQSAAFRRIADAIDAHEVDMVVGHVSGMATCSDGSGRKAQSHFNEMAFNHPPEHS